MKINIERDNPTKFFRAGSSSIKKFNSEKIKKIKKFMLKFLGAAS